MTKPAHQRALDTLIHRRGQWSLVFLRDGRTSLVFDIAWGFDLGEEIAHITTNVSPGPRKEPDPAFPVIVEFFTADDILRIEDLDTGTALFSLPES